MRPHRQVVLTRFVAACRADERVVSAVVAGSYACGTADAYSDLDLGLITADAAYEDFLASRTAFIHRLGEPLFLEDYDDEGAVVVFFILADGMEGELALGRASHFTHIHRGPYVVLLDRIGLLQGAVFSGRAPDPDEQREALRGLISWFWHDLSHHFLTAIARGQLWSEEPRGGDGRPPEQAGDAGAPGRRGGALAETASGARIASRRSSRCR